MGATRNIFAALFALAIPFLADKFGRKNVYSFALIAGGIGLFAMLFSNDKYSLILTTLGVGIAWAAILALPYAILSKSLPAKQTGAYMGIFNFTITIPQIIAAASGGFFLKNMFNGSPIHMLALAGVSMAVAGIAALLVIKE